MMYSHFDMTSRRSSFTRTAGLIAGLVATSALAPLPASAVVNGTVDATTPAANAVVQVGGCTGTLIAPDLVITAAHCRFLNNPDPARYPEIAGAWQNNAEWLRLDVAVNFGISPQRPVLQRRAIAGSLAGWADVLMLKLDQPVPATVAVPMAVATTNPLASIADWNTASLRAVGYGGTPLRQGLNATGAFPTCKDANIQDWSYGNDEFNCLKTIRRSGAGLPSLVPGDSGGPLIVNTARGPLLIGVYQGNVQNFRSCPNGVSPFNYITTCAPAPIAALGTAAGCITVTNPDSGRTLPTTNPYHHTSTFFAPGARCYRLPSDPPGVTRKTADIRRFITDKLRTNADTSLSRPLDIYAPPNAADAAYVYGYGDQAPDTYAFDTRIGYVDNPWQPAQWGTRKMLPLYRYTIAGTNKQIVTTKYTGHPQGAASIGGLNLRDPALIGMVMDTDRTIPTGATPLYTYSRRDGTGIVNTTAADLATRFPTVYRLERFEGYIWRTRR